VHYGTNPEKLHESKVASASWLAAMRAILDSCALLLAGLREVKTFPAKMAFATSRLSLALPLPGWLPDESLDNSQNSPRGRRAKQLGNNGAARPN
jgi:hypothetical protein